MLGRGTPAFRAENHHSVHSPSLVMGEGKEGIKCFLPLGSCQDITDLGRRGQRSRGCGPYP